MSPRLLFAYLTLSLLEPLLALAKPPDLPVDLQAYYQNLAKQRQIKAHQSPRPSPLLPPASDPIPGQVKELEAEAQEAQDMPEGECPCLDASCLEFVGMLGKIIQVINEDRQGAIESEVLEVMPKEVQTQAEPPNKLSLSPRHGQARDLFRIGERCWHRGDLDMARNCYEEVCRIAPRSPYGLMASAQLLRMKEQPAIQQTGGSEAQEPPVATPSRDDEEQALIEELYRKADKLRKQSHAEPVCPFRRQASPPGPGSRPDKPHPDEDLSDAEMQEMLDDAQLLETFLDDLVAPEGDNQNRDDVYKDILVNVSEQAISTGLCRPEELTVAPAPRELTIEEEPQRTTNQPASRGHRPASLKQRFSSPRVNTPERNKP